MFVVTMTKKKITRVAFIALAVLVGAAILIYGIFSSINARADTKKLPIYSVMRTDNKIALTFDVAWENSNTEQLLEILKTENIKATFFVTGDWCDRYPEDVLKFFEAGHAVENHSDQHPHIKGLNVNSLIDDTREASKKIENITNVKPTLYRAPYGEYDDMSLTTLEGMGLKTIQWDVDSIDWKKISSDDIVKRVVEQTKSGSILLFHNDLENTTKALPEVIKQLKAKGFSFVPVSDMIFDKDYTIDHTGKQIYQDPALLTFFDKAKALQVLNSEKGDRLKEIALKYITADEAAALKDGITVEIIEELMAKMSDEDKTEVLALLAEVNAETTESKDETTASATSDFVKGIPVEQNTTAPTENGVTIAPKGSPEDIAPSELDKDNPTPAETTAETTAEPQTTPQATALP